MSAPLLACWLLLLPLLLPRPLQLPDDPSTSPDDSRLAFLTIRPAKLALHRPYRRVDQLCWRAAVRSDWRLQRQRLRAELQTTWMKTYRAHREEILQTWKQPAALPAPAAWLQSDGQQPLRQPSPSRERMETRCG